MIPLGLRSLISELEQGPGPGALRDVYELGAGEWGLSVEGLGGRFPSFELVTDGNEFDLTIEDSVVLQGSFDDSKSLQLFHSLVGKQSQLQRWVWKGRVIAARLETADGVVRAETRSLVPKFLADRDTQVFAGTDSG